MGKICPGLRLQERMVAVRTSRQPVKGREHEKARRVRDGKKAQAKPGKKSSQETKLKQEKSSVK